MNDLQEANLEVYYPNLKTFKSCSFSMTNKESIPMWKIYGNNDNTGAAIKFVFYKRNNFNALFQDETIVGHEITYVKINQFNRYARGELIKDINEGFSKSSCWSYEKEYRFGTFENSSNDFFYINLDCIKKIEVILFPKTGTKISAKNIKKQRLKEIKNSPLYEKISFSTSTFAKAIKK